MHWILSEEGVYQCRYVPAEAGDYSVAVRVVGAGGTGGGGGGGMRTGGWDKVKPAATGFLVTEPLVEFSDSNLKADVLRRAARTANGRYLSYADPAALTEEIVREIEKRIETAEATGAEADTKAIWDMPALYLLLMGLMGGEWLVRRRSGLA